MRFGIEKLVAEAGFAAAVLEPVAAALAHLATG
jgi:hypothetical protein